MVSLALSRSLGPDAVWTKGGLVISEPQHPIADRLHPPTALDWTRPWLNQAEGDKVQLEVFVLKYVSHE